MLPTTNRPELMPLGLPFLTQVNEIRLTVQRGVARQRCVVGFAARRPKDGHDAVPQVLVDVPTMLEDDVGHGRQILVQQLHEGLRLELLRDGGEAGHVREEDRQFLLFAPQLDAFGIAHDLIHDLGRHVPVEHGA
jgi:hypothetical protein